MIELHALAAYDRKGTHNFLSGLAQAIDAIHGTRICRLAVVHDAPLICRTKAKRNPIHVRDWLLKVWYSGRSTSRGSVPARRPEQNRSKN